MQNSVPHFGSLIAGEPAHEEAVATIDLIAPSGGQLVARVDEAGADLIDRAVATAAAAFAAHRKTSAAQRARWLIAAADAISDARDELVDLLISHVGKPRRLAEFEVARSVQFVRLTATELLTLRGELLPLDAVDAGAGRFGFARRVPYGVVAGITPFNAPINLLVQKLAPALAAGNAIVVKPALQGTAVALRVADAFARAELPGGLLNVVAGGKDPALALAAHPSVAAMTFTGGTAAGHALARAAGAKRFLAELGSNAANVVLADADVDNAAQRIASAAFEAGGQQCISAQRVIVANEIFGAFLERFVAAARKLRVGDPAQATTDIGPLIHEAAAERVIGLVEDSRERGARIALEPTRRGASVSPGIVVDPPADARILHEEAFGPVVAVLRAANVDAALALANDSQFGLQGAVFTSSLEHAFRFADDFDVGAMWINEASRFRLDMYPFGGVKQSGVGREGVRYAIDELSQVKFVGITPR
ncbi:MAG TPA: aldehyde dehydrogenase family protein [Paraburkholderia sp.]|jgi:acyl-CoA reductase-like NAD-dependent aldehyde dehydrogenase